MIINFTTEYQDQKLDWGVEVTGPVTNPESRILYALWASRNVLPAIEAWEAKGLADITQDIQIEAEARYVRAIDGYIKNRLPVDDAQGADIH